MQRLRFVQKTLLWLCFALSLQFQARAYAQQVTIHVKNSSLEDVMKQIRQQTGFLFVYDLDMLGDARNVTADISAAPLEKALSAVFDGQPFSFAIVDKTVVLKKKTAAATAAARSARIMKIRGMVSDESGQVLPGVTVHNRQNKANALTDALGTFTIDAEKGDSLIFTMIGMQPFTEVVREEKLLKITLKQKVSDVGEVVVVAYGTQKKSSMVSAVTSINPKELKGPTSNLTTMLAGRLSGVISYQRSGEPGQDNASFFIRGITTFGTGKVDPLILIDGMESTTTDLARLQPDDISGFSILKDATASSLYGARGANGVVLVSTKSGQEGKTRFLVRLENSLSTNTRNFKFADNITYMKLANEAVLTRDPLGDLPYTQEKIERTAAGDDPLLYPNNNWIKQLIKPSTNNQRLNFSMNGGGKVAQYYIAGTYNIDNGVLKVDKLNNFNSNIKLRNYSIRSNININLTPTTVGIVRTYGQFDDYNGPIGGGATRFSQAVWANPVDFPAVYPKEYAPQLNHPLFGSAVMRGYGSTPGDGGNLFFNPYALSVSGYQESNTSNLLAQLEIRQDFKFVTPGLQARVMAYTERFASFQVQRGYQPFYYKLQPGIDGEPPRLQPLNTNGTEYLSYSPSDKVTGTTSYLEAAVNYNRNINKHTFSGMLITIFRGYLTGNGRTLQTSLPYRNQGVSGRFTYDYDDRYMLEANFGYNGSERFAASHRYGFFPSVGAAWNVYQEKFFEPYVHLVDKLKVRGTYGLVGNDQIGGELDRFFYLSDVNMNDGGRGATFGERYGVYKPGVSVRRYENKFISWEKSQKANIGIELGLFNALNLQADIFREHRSNILMQRNTLPTTLGLNAPISANVGEAEGKGIDLSLDYNFKFKRNAWLQVRGTFTFAQSKLLVNEEPKYKDNESYRSQVGQPLSQRWGYIAERLFVDDQEVLNSPQQNFGQRVYGGDIKYRDVNRDGVINSADAVPIGLPQTPEITYGFGASMGWKTFDFSFFFQGSARSSFWIDSYITTPFVQNGGGQHGLLKVIAEDHWSESNRNLYAFWPRLSNYFVQNNYQSSTWWMRSGDFLRLKSVELGFTLPDRMQKRLKMTNTRIYANAMNLFAISKFKLWDVEMGGNGLGYPVQRVVNAGISLGF
ncbi:TonB-dependent receptor [Chitinophaga sp. NPDC101104]|uniref:TonB-dependent receptor n=1 Tax=Chitinophaga sp. NPDC101104 TaxID=3390561 RepID=UPI003D05D729